jgi:hypothetical protein
MNGFPLILLGVVLFAVAYALLKIQSKMKEVTNAIDMGFKTIEDGITQNLLGKDGALTKASTAIETSYTAMEIGIKENLLGKNGLLGKGDAILLSTSDLCVQVSTEITNGKNAAMADFNEVTEDIGQVLQDVGEPMLDVGKFMTDVGNGINQEILGEHPFEGLAKPFLDAGTTCTGIGDKILLAHSDLDKSANKVKKLGNTLDGISSDIKAMGPKIDETRLYMDKTFKDGVNATMGDLKGVKDDVKSIFTAMEKGAQASVDNLKNANTYLDAQINGMFQRKYITGLLAAGVALILAGAALGI